MCAIVPGTTRKHAPVVSTALLKRHPIQRHCGLKILGQGLALSYWEHSHQSKVFQAPADLAGTGYHSGNLRPCAVSLTLRYSSHVGQDFASSPSRYVQNSRLAIVSSPDFSELISGGRIQKHPLIRPGLVFPYSAPSLLLLTGKGLTPLSSLSFSCSAFVQRIPEGSQPPTGRCCHHQTPDASVRYPNLSSLSPDWP